MTTKGACCYYDGSCAFVTEYECYDNGTGTPGTWNEGDSCPAANCEDQVLGSCCSDTDCLGDMTLTQCLQCVDAINSNGSCPGGTVPDSGRSLP